MKSNSFKLFVTTTLLVYSTYNLNGQFVKADQITIFGNRLNNPIEMDVQVNGNQIIFNAVNKSYYPYEFEIKFSELQNLTPRILQRAAILYPGKNSLFTLSQEDLDQPPQYSYSIKYIMGTSNNNTDLSFPYLIPVGDRKIVKLASKNENGTTLYLENHFKMNTGDTVFSVRKGLVTALPDSKTVVDRIMKNASLEIRHGDGTVAVYGGIDPGTNNLKLGQVVFPGQPVGQIGNSEVLILNIIAFQGGGRFQNLDIYFADKSEQLLSSRKIMDKQLAFPESVIKKELTKKELKKFDAGKLF
jgi:murein DD-endopeptidase MepM/ murein hydrolase activator NlpD